MEIEEKVSHLEKEESKKNDMMIQKLKEQEMLKNASIKEMVRKQKLDAEE